jgi:ATP-dependent DNA ligase
MARGLARRRHAEAAALPQWVRPPLTQLVDAAPDGDQWLHEIKYDGYRMHARLDHGAVKLLTRTGLDWTHKYPAIAKAVGDLDARQAYLDGELCGVGPDGTMSFNIVQLRNVVKITDPNKPFYSHRHTATSICATPACRTDHPPSKRTSSATSSAMRARGRTLAMASGGSRH